MLKLRPLFFLLAALSLSGQTTEPPLRGDAPIRVGPGPAAFWTTLAGAQKLFPGAPVRVAIEPYKAGAPWEAESSNGDIYEQTEEGGAKSEMVKAVVSAGWHALTTGEKVLFYEGIGPKAVPLGATLKRDVYRMAANDKFIQVAEAESAYRELPDGERVLMTRSAGATGPWTAAAMTGKIFQMDAKGAIAQAGSCGYYWVIVNGKRHALVFLSKGMRKTDKWMGERDGVLYVGR